MKLFIWSYGKFFQIFNKNSLLRALTHLEFIFFTEIEQVSKLLIVKLHKRAKNKKLFFWSWLGFGHYGFKTSGNYSSLLLWFKTSHHGMSFTGSSLTISKYCTIVSLYDFIDEIGSSWLIDLLLLWILREYVIETEDFIFSWISINVLNE